MKWLKHILLTLLVVIILLPLLTGIALQFPAVQKRCAAIASQKLSNYLGSTASVGDVYIVPFNRFVFKDIILLSKSDIQETPQDTLLNILKLSLHIRGFNPISKHLTISKINIDGGSFNFIRLKEDNNLSLVLDKVKDPNKKRDTTKTFDWKINVKRVLIDNFGFSFIDERHRQGPVRNPKAINFRDMHLSNIKIDGRNLKFNKEKGAVECDLQSLSCHECKGYDLRRVSGKISVSSTQALIEDLEIIDDYSNVTANFFAMRYKSSKDFGKFTRLVELEADFNNAYLDFETLLAYARNLREMPFKCYVTGHAKGTVNGLSSKGIKVQTATKKSELNCKFNFNGLPKVSMTTAFMDIESLHTTSGELFDIVKTFSSRDLTKKFKHVGNNISIDFNGRLAGLLTDFVANGNLHTSVGDIYTDILVNSTPEDYGFEMEGTLKTKKFNTTPFTGIEQLGEITLFSKATMHINEGDHSIHATLDTLNIQDLEFNGQHIKNIQATAYYKKEETNIYINSSDDKCSFTLFSDIGTEEDSKHYRFLCDLQNIDLNYLKLLGKDTTTTIRGNIDAHITKHNSLNKFQGDISATNLIIQDPQKADTLKSAQVTLNQENGEHEIKILSSALDAKYSGSASVTESVSGAINGFCGHIKSMFANSPKETKPINSTLKADIKDFGFITSLFVPQLTIANGSSVIAHSSTDGADKITIKSPSIKFNNLTANNLTIYAKQDSSGASTAIYAQDFNNSSVEVYHPHILAFAEKDDIKLHAYLTDSLNTESISEINVSGKIFSPRDMSFKIDTSYFILGKYKWDIAPSDINILQNKVFISNFNLGHGIQTLSVNGIISPEEQDTLSINFNKFDLSLSKLILPRAIQIGGTATGKGKIASVTGNGQLFADISGENLSLNNTNLGDYRLMSGWNKTSGRVDFSLLTSMGKNTPLDLIGSYYPQNKDVDIKVTLDKFPVDVARPYLNKILNDISGYASGTAYLYGPTHQLTLEGKGLTANNISFTVDYTKVKYHLNGKVDLEDKGMHLYQVAVADTYGNMGSADGYLLYNHFRNLGFDFNINFNNMHVINLKDYENTIFYGQGFASGNYKLHGDLKQINMDISARTEKNTNIHIPIKSISEAGETDILTFVTKDTLATYTAQNSEQGTEDKKSKSRVALDIKLDVTPDAYMNIEINKVTGDVIHAIGNGIVNMVVDPVQDKFDITGDYNVLSGDYLFVLQGILSKKFEIESGGDIQFNGDIMKSTLDLTATYRTKASINALLSDTTTVSTRRTTLAKIKMNGQLSNPQLGFDIDVEDLEPSVKARVDAALNTDDKMMKQFMTLLVSGNFFPDNESGIVNNSNILYSNVSEILSNQLNNVFTQLNIPLDVGFSYQPGAESGHDAFDVAISTQLFNNKVVLNGNVGNNINMNNSSDEKIVGDVDMEFKIDDAGKFRLKLFSHSADQYSNYLDNTQRNGGGFVYQEEFNTFKELWQRMFRSKRKFRKLLQKQVDEAHLN